METNAVSYRPPQQDRSRRALQKVLGAAETVLVDKGFDDFTMTAVAEQADVSVGAIYRRFEGKDQLLDAVWDSLLAKMEGDLATALENAAPTLAGVVNALVRASVADLSGNKLFPYLYAPSMAQSTRVHDAISTRRKLFLAAVEPHLGEVTRHNSRIAVVMVQAMVTGSCVHRASQGNGVEDGLTWNEFAANLETIAMSYLFGPVPHVSAQVRAAVALRGHIDARPSYRALGVPETRVEILRFLVAVNEASVSQLMVELGLTRNGVTQHLRVLEKDGIAQCRHTTHPRGSGPITYWRVEEEALESAFDDFFSYLFAR